MDAALVVTIVTSAAVGALVSSALTLLGQALERQARRREVLLHKAVDLAFRRTDTMMKLADMTGAAVNLRDDVSLAAAYYRELESLLSTGDLTDRFREVERRSDPRQRQ